MASKSDYNKPTSSSSISSSWILFYSHSLVSLFLFFPLSSSYPQPQIQLACKATRYPEICQSSLSESHNVPQNPTPEQMIQSAIWVSSEKLKAAKPMVKSILDDSANNLNRSNAAKTCLKTLDYSHSRAESASDALPRGRLKDARVWYSAALTYQYDCWSALKYVNDTKLVDETMAFLDSLLGLTSNALSMMMSFDNFGDDFNTWRTPGTERTGFWEKVKSNGTQLGDSGGFPSKLSADATVCKDGSCHYKTVQDAVNAAPDNATKRRLVINIKEGVYEEIVRIPFEKKNVVFLGDGMGKTVITGSLHVGQPGMTTYESATVGKFHSFIHRLFSSQRYFFFQKVLEQKYNVIQKSLAMGLWLEVSQSRTQQALILTKQ